MMAKLARVPPLVSVAEIGWPTLAVVGTPLRTGRSARVPAHRRVFRSQLPEIDPRGQYREDVAPWAVCNQGRPRRPLMLSAAQGTNTKHVWN